MERLAAAVERIDGPLDDPPALVANLRDLRRINRWLGGATLSARAVGILAGDRRPVRILDVGTGGADIPVLLLREAARRGRPTAVTAVDHRPEMRAAALAMDPGLAFERDLRYEIHDGRELPYPERSFDIAHASLLVHHLDPPDAVAVLAELRRVSRLGVIVNDLDRSRLALLGARLMTRTITRAAWTRSDAPLSVRRAYRPDELEAMVRAAGLRPIGRLRHRLGDRYAIVAVPAASTGG